MADQEPAAPSSNGDETMTDVPEGDTSFDPLVQPYDSVVQEDQWVLLYFADGRQVFCQAVTTWKGKTPPLKVNKKNYSTYNLIGLPYGTVLELGKNKLVPLEAGEDLLPVFEQPALVENSSTTDNNGSSNDNRNLVDDNDSQAMKAHHLLKLKEDGLDGSKIIQSLIEGSSTFDSKTEFSKAKWIARKQKKYQVRCRLVQCTGRTVCQAFYMKDARKIMNLRDDSLGQMLSYANICAGRQVLVYDTTMGLVVGALAQRMGGYGKILSLYSGQQPACVDMLDRFNLNFAELHSIKWLHTEDVYSESASVSMKELNETDVEAKDRDQLQWPCLLQDHTRKHLEKLEEDGEDVTKFLLKRSTRFARKLTRTSPLEVRAMLHARPSDSVLICTKNDPTDTLLGMLPHLGPSCPFVVFCEYMEPLAHCFLKLQEGNLAINLRLTDTWMRDYQVLPGRTHPMMHMSQNGGFLLTGIKLDPENGVDVMDEALRKEIRDEIGGRRGKKKRASTPNGEGGRKNKKTKSK